MTDNLPSHLIKKSPLRRHSIGTISHTPGESDYDVEQKTVELQRGELLRIRLYQHSDASLVRKLFIQGMSYGESSPLEIAIRERNRSPLAIVAYVTVIIGIELVCFARKPPFPYLGITLAIAGYTFTFLHRRHIRKVFDGFLQQSLNDDLADIPQSYGLVFNVKENESVLVRNGKSAFWVAELVEEGRRLEIAGIVGFDANRKNSVTKTVGELRRMVISPNHRRKGIGKHLISTVIAHAKANGTENIALSISSFNMPAVGMYQKLGWKIENTRPLSDEPKAQIYDLTLDVTSR